MFEIGVSFEVRAYQNRQVSRFVSCRWPDNFMVEMKLTPDDIALTTPAYYTTDRKALLEQREKCIEDLIANANKCQ